MRYYRNELDKFQMDIKSISPGLVFVYDKNPYLKTTESNCAVNISNGEMKYFNEDLIVDVTEFKYSY